MQLTSFDFAVKCLLSIVLPMMLSLPVSANGPLKSPGNQSATRGLENSGLDQYVTALQQNDRDKISAWFQWQADRFQNTRVPFESQFAESMKLLSQRVGSEDFVALIFREQLKLRKGFRPSTSSDLGNERRLFVLLQSILEETVMHVSLKLNKNNFVLKATDLAPSETQRAGKIKGAEVLAGDVVIQIGSEYMSSHFIAHSQSHPGLASHGLIVSKAGAYPEILEALIEDGVHRRDPTTASLARMWVLSASTERDRAKTREAVERFIEVEKIPFVAGGSHGVNSPLLYDSSMNPDRRKEGSYFCTALVQEIYQRAELSKDQIPYLEDGANWSVLKGNEKSLYQLLGIDRTRVPAPSDALMNPELQLRSLVLDAEGLRSSRRLRAMVDAFYDLLTFNPELKAQLFAAFEQIPAHEIQKHRVLAMFSKAEQLHPGIAKYRIDLEASLPQTANLRQIIFFFVLNKVIQDRSLVALKNYETVELRRHARPGELRARAGLLWQNEILRLSQFIESFNGQPARN